MGDSLLIRLTAEPIDAAEVLAFLGDPGAGGTVLFAGTVRDHSGAGEVTGLDYEAWEERASALMLGIGEEILARWPVGRVALVHRTGHLEIGETSVLVGCSSPHRAEAFDAARHGIERIKGDVPIWKKEGLVTGAAHWVQGS